MRNRNLESILEMSVAERVQLAQDIWDSVVVDSSKLPLTDAQRRELDRRLASYRADPTAGSSWELVRARISKGR
jgi:putative addiction module component (TIGR02574 family)